MAIIARGVKYGAVNEQTKVENYCGIVLIAVTSYTSQNYNIISMYTSHTSYALCY